MVRLSADLIQGAAQSTNPIKERELDLRGKFAVNILIVWNRHFGWVAPIIMHF